LSGVVAGFESAEPRLRIDIFMSVPVADAQS
jgi:hypothetical protein